MADACGIGAYLRRWPSGGASGGDLAAAQCRDDDSAVALRGCSKVLGEVWR